MGLLHRHLQRGTPTERKVAKLCAIFPNPLLKLRKSMKS